MNPSFPLIPVASALHDPQAVQDILSSFLPHLLALGAIPSDGPPSQPPVVWFVMTGGTERRLLDPIEAFEKQMGPQPVLLLSHAGHNALPAALETLAKLQQDGRKGRIIHLKTPDDLEGYADLANAIADHHAWLQLRSMRLGMVGEPSDWLVASHPQDIQATWGPTIVPIDMSELYAAWDDQLQPSPEPLPCEVCRSDWNEAIRMQNALERIVEKRKLDAITVRCFDLLEKRNTTGCLALAKLNDDGVPAACEGDLASAIGMAWVHALLKQPAWMANPASIDQQTNTLLLAHCTVPRSMTTSIGLRTHFESGKGVALAGQLAPGPITLLRVGGCKLEQIWMSEGQILSSGCDENLCRTQVTVRLEGAEVRDLLAYPLGNHLLVIQGHHAKRLRMWWQIFLSNATDTRNGFRAPF